MAGTPMYYGPAERRRFAMVHTPDEGSGPAVVLCPPLAYEAVCAHAALLDLADLLADAGCTVVRIDYDGTGNSVGSDTDPDRVAAWLASIDDAVDHFVDRGWEPVTLLGLRIGATLAATVAAQRNEVTRPCSGTRLLTGAATRGPRS